MFQQIIVGQKQSSNAVFKRKKKNGVCFCGRLQNCVAFDSLFVIGKLEKKSSFALTAPWLDLWTWNSLHEWHGVHIFSHKGIFFFRRTRTTGSLFHDHVICMSNTFVRKLKLVFSSTFSSLRRSHAHLRTFRVCCTANLSLWCTGTFRDNAKLRTLECTYVLFESEVRVRVRVRVKVRVIGLGLGLGSELERAYRQKHRIPPLSMPIQPRTRAPCEGKFTAEPNMFRTFCALRCVGKYNNKNGEKWKPHIYLLQNVAIQTSLERATKSHRFKNFCQRMGHAWTDRNNTPRFLSSCVYKGHLGDVTRWILWSKTRTCIVGKEREQEKNIQRAHR